MRRFAFLFIVVLVFAVGCATTSGLIPGLDPGPVTSLLVRDLTAAQANFEASGYTVEARCMAEVIARLTPTPGKSLTIDGLVSAGSVVYINAREVRAMLGTGGQLAPECLQMVGALVTMRRSGIGVAP